LAAQKPEESKVFWLLFFKKVTSFFASKTAVGCAPRAARLHHAVFRGPTMTAA
jgi:hypothetical protein